MVFFFFKQKTAYEMRISDWSSDVCSSDLAVHVHVVPSRIVSRVLRLRLRVLRDRTSGFVRRSGCPVLPLRGRREPAAKGLQIAAPERRPRQADDQQEQRERHHLPTNDGMQTEPQHATTSPQPWI